MITITASSSPLGTLHQIGGLSTPLWDGKTQSAWVWMAMPSTSPSSASDVLDGSFLRQGKEAHGRLRDKAVAHRNLNGAINIACNAPSLYTDNYGDYLMKSGVVTRCDLMVISGSAGSSTVTYPRQSRYFMSKFYQDSPGVYRRTVVTYTPLANDYYVVTTRWAFCAVDVYNLYPTTYLRTDAAYDLYYTQVGRFVNGRAYSGPFKSWGSSVPSTEGIAAEVAKYSQGSAIICPILTGYDSTSYGDPASVVAITRAHIVSLDYGDIQSYCTSHSEEFGEMAVEAAKSLRYVEKNILLILQDLIRLREAAASLLQLLSSKEWQAVLKAYHYLKIGFISRKTFFRACTPFGNMYLQWKYVYAPNLGDLSLIGQGIADAMFKDKSTRVHSRKVIEEILPNERVLRHTMVFTAEVNTFGERDWGMLQEFVYLGKRWGMYPELQNLWDVLIYSFVVDWFVQYGDFFAQVDTFLSTANYFPVKYCILSEKFEYILDANDVVPSAYADRATGMVNVSYYNRWITEDIPLPSVELSANTSLSKHWAEAGFLIAQRLR